MIDWYPWIVLAHVIGAFAFVLAHGVSAFVAFRLRTERRPEHVVSLLELSNSAIGVMYPALLLLLAAGIAAGFVGGWWGRLWIWLALGLLIGIATAMYLLGTAYYVELRTAVGMRPPQKAAEPAPEPVSAEALAAKLDTKRPFLLAAIGGGGLALILWLMVMKPW